MFKQNRLDKYDRTSFDDNNIEEQKNNNQGQNDHNMNPFIKNIRNEQFHLPIRSH